MNKIYNEIWRVCNKSYNGTQQGTKEMNYKSEMVVRVLSRWMRGAVVLDLKYL